MNRFALTFALLITCGAVAYAGPESIRSSSKEMKETVAPAPPECDFTWTGFYLGINGGYGWGDNEDTHFRGEPPPFDQDFITISNDIDGGFGGGQLGYNWQIGRHFVIGAETDIEGADISGDHVLFGFTPGNPHVFIPPPNFIGTSEDINWFGTFRGRIGFAPFCRLLIYGTGGLAYGDTDYEAVVNVVPLGGPVWFGSRSETNVGWTAGGGLEFAIAKHWTIKAEYLYIDLGSESTTASSLPVTPIGVHMNWDTQFHTFKGGLNFKF